MKPASKTKKYLSLDSWWQEAVELTLQWLRKEAQGKGAVHAKMGVSTNGGTPIAGWFMSWKIPFTWMTTGGTPMTMETPKCSTNTWDLAIENG